MKTAIIYARVSTTRQSDEGISIESQIELGMKKASDLGANVLNVFHDDGKSGRSDRRRAFQRAIQYCTFEQVDYFITWNTARFARNRIDAASYKRLLEGVGTRVIYVSMDIDNRTDEGWFSESLHEIMDEHYSRQVSRDTKRSMMKNARDGYWNGGFIPLGFKTEEVGKRKKLTVDEQSAPIVREIFRRYLAGEGTKSIAIELNRRGLSLRNKPFSKDNIRLILGNFVYIGMSIFNRTTGRRPNPESEWVMYETHNGIIDKEVFMAARARLEEGKETVGKGSPLSQHVFTGLLKCGKCGLAMRIETATGRSRTYSYYNCSGYQKGHGCGSRRINAEKFDRYLLEVVLDKVLQADIVADFITEAQQMFLDKRSEKQPRIDLIQSELRDIRHRRQALYDILEKMGTAAPNMDEMLLRAKSYTDREKLLTNELESINNEPEYEPISDTDLKDAVNVLKGVIMKSKSIEKIRAMLQHFIERIDVNDDEIMIHYRPELIIKEKCPEPNVVQSMDSWLPVFAQLRTKILTIQLAEPFRKAA